MVKLKSPSGVIAAFPEPMIELAGVYDENSNNEVRAALRVMERYRVKFRFLVCLLSYTLPLSNGLDYLGLASSHTQLA